MRSLRRPQPDPRVVYQVASCCLDYPTAERELHIGDLVNVTGSVTLTADGEPEIGVVDPAAVARIPAPASLAAATAATTTASDDPGTTTAIQRATML